MTAKIITFGISKGGCSKSTSSGITSFLLSKDEKVLAIDMDGQGNLTSFLTGEYDICNAFEEKTVLEAILEEDARSYIIKIKENLDLIPSNDFLATLPRKMFEKHLRLDALQKALEPVMEDYDWIIIDTPPALSEQTVMPLSTYSEAGSFAVVMFDGSMFAYYAIPKFLEIIEGAKGRYNPSLKTAGILFSLIDSRAKENEVMLEAIEEDYPSLKFNTIIKRKASTRRLAIEGFEGNAELRNALEYYYPFVEELKERVSQKQPQGSN
ncbi:ParA family protein [Bacillus sp. ISL-40]|uniref:ParA family protein n=1 Tax=unclassified Bacillus (in: firmicutes) TaxID=185979 RepID=UPI001BE986CE|nr:MULTISPECIES: ParA family protein [unclassified Bacillus (in: firmicutes)]MBT2701122.1 ParA family protein [Bacillus sp. ISL-40]MBT2722805.1 ParA family protein [Bacillus sp. ISL-46]MBT2743653.1 ParA family protein [Bacillus sp. ISL-77]